MHSIKIEQCVLDEWQDISNLVAHLCKVPSTLLMQKNDQTLHVVIASDHPDSPFRANQKINSSPGSFCNQVIETQQPLHVPNVLKEPEWAESSVVKSGMVSYYGVPINWPDGSVFGSFCVLDNKASIRSEMEITLINQFAHIIELTLELTYSKDKMYQLSITDDLTQVPNRRYFFDNLYKEFKRSRRHDSTFSVAMFDIDHFKSINDIYGHSKGDEVLVNFAQQLQQIIRKEDTLGRIGGEEFALIMPHTNLDEALNILGRFKKHFDSVLVPPGDQRITFSAGLAELTDSCENAESLIKRADKLLYQAKQEGRNRICC
jgi:diguanylate cyclase (GGDEF)-like protein